MTSSYFVWNTNWTECSWSNLRFWHSWQSRPSRSQVSLWLASRWRLAEYGLTWLSSTWSRASRALSCTEFSESTTAGTTPCSQAFCTTLHSGLTWWSGKITFYLSVFEILLSVLLSLRATGWDSQWAARPHTVGPSSSQRQLGLCSAPTA